jgi:hypothetical protein
MNSFREMFLDAGKLDPQLSALIAENAKRYRTEMVPAEPLPKRIFDGPKYDGKECAVCHRHFKSSAEYVTCRLCRAYVCRRKHECKSLHHAQHRLAGRRAQQEEEASHG